MVTADDDDDSDCLYIDERDPCSPENPTVETTAADVAKQITTELRNTRMRTELPAINYFPLMKNIDLKAIENNIKEEKPRIACKDFSRTPFADTNMIAGTDELHPLAGLEKFGDITMAAAQVNRNADGSIQLHVPEATAEKPMDLTTHSMAEVKDTSPSGSIVPNVATVNANRQASVIVPNSSPRATLVSESPRYDAFNKACSPASNVGPISSTQPMPPGVHSPPPYCSPLSGHLPTTSGYHLKLSANSVTTGSASYGPPPAQRPDGSSGDLLTRSTTAYNPSSTPHGPTSAPYGPPSLPYGPQSPYGPPSPRLPPPMSTNYGPHYGHHQYPEAYKRQMYSHHSHAEYYAQATSSYNQTPFRLPRGPYPPMRHPSYPHHHRPMHPHMAYRMSLPFNGTRLPLHAGLQRPPMIPWNDCGQPYGTAEPPHFPYKGRDINGYLAEMKEQDYMLKKKQAEKQQVITAVTTSESANKPAKAIKRTNAKISTSSNTTVVRHSNTVINNPGANVNTPIAHNIPNWGALVSGTKPSEIEPKSPPYNSLWPSNMPNGPMALTLLKTQVTRTNNITISLVDSSSVCAKKPKISTIPDNTQKATITEDIGTTVNNTEPISNSTVALDTTSVREGPLSNMNEKQKEDIPEVHSTMNTNTRSSENITTTANNVEGRHNATIALIASISSPKKPKIKITYKTQKYRDTQHSKINASTYSQDNLTSTPNYVEIAKQPFNTVVPPVEKTSTCTQISRTNHISDETRETLDKDVNLSLNMDADSSEDVTTVPNNVQQKPNMIAAPVDSTSPCTQEPTTINISGETNEAVDKGVNLTSNMDTNSSGNIPPIGENVDKTSDCAQKPKTKNISDETQKMVDKEVSLTSNANTSLSEDITSVSNNVESINNAAVALIDTSNKIQREIDPEVDLRTDTRSENITTETNDVETSNVIDLTDDTNCLEPTEQSVTTINKDDPRIPLIMEPDAEIEEDTREADDRAVIETELDIGEEWAPKITNIPTVRPWLIVNNDKSQIKVAPKSKTTVQSSAYQVEMSTTSTTTEKYLHTVERNAISRSERETLIETEFNRQVDRTSAIFNTATVDHRVETKFTKVFSLISVDYLKNILNTVGNVQTNFEETINDIDTTHEISQTSAVSHNETTQCQESRTVSNDHTLEIARKKLALLSNMEDGSSSAVSENMHTSTGSNYQTQISTEEKDEYFGPVTERLQDSLTGASNSELILHSNMNQQIEVSPINRRIENSPEDNVTNESGENTNNNNSTTESIIDEIWFFKFQISFFRLVQERLAENNCHELAYELSNDIHDLIARSDMDEATSDMKYKCHICLNEAIYSPRTLYYKLTNHLEKTIAKIQSCSLCITFREKYVEVLKKYIAKELPNKGYTESLVNTNNVQSLSETTFSDSVQEDNIAANEDHNASNQIDDDEIENQLSIITNGVPLSQQDKIDDETSNTSHPVSSVSSTKEDHDNDNFVIKLPTNGLKESTMALLKKGKSNMIKSDENKSLDNGVPDNNDKEKNIYTESNKHLEIQTTNANLPGHDNINNLNNNVNHNQSTQMKSIMAASCANTDTKTASKNNDIINHNKEKHRKRKPSVSVDTRAKTNPELQNKNTINVGIPANTVTSKPGKNVKKSNENKSSDDGVPGNNGKEKIINTETNGHVETQTTNANLPRHDNNDNLNHNQNTQMKSIMDASCANTVTETASKNNEIVNNNKEKHRKRKASVSIDTPIDTNPEIQNKNTINMNVAAKKVTSQPRRKSICLKIHLSPNPEHSRVILNDDHSDQERKKNRILQKSISLDTATNKNREQKRKSSPNSTDQEEHHKRRKSMNSEIASSKTTSEPQSNVDTSNSREKQLKSKTSSAENADSSNSESRTKDTNHTSNNNKRDKKHEKRRKSTNTDTEPNKEQQNKNSNTDDNGKNHNASKNATADIDVSTSDASNTGKNNVTNTAVNVSNDMHAESSIATKSTANNDPASTDARKDVSSNSQAENEESDKTSNTESNKKTNNADAQCDSRKESGDAEKDGQETTEDHNTSKKRNTSEDANETTDENNTVNRRNTNEEVDANAEKSNETVARALEVCTRTLKENCSDEKELPQVKISGKEKVKKTVKKSKRKQDCLEIRDISYKYMCHVCTVNFSYLSSCLSHMKENHKIYKPTVPSSCVTKKCAFCPLYITDNNNLYNYHVRTAHPDIFSHIVE